MKQFSNSFFPSPLSQAIRWNPYTGQGKCLLRGHTAGIHMMRVSVDVVVTASYDYTVKVWAGLHGECLHTLSHPGGEITCMGIGSR